MFLKVLLPTGILISQPVSKILAEGMNGSFCLLPRHIDCVAVLVPGILTFLDQQECEVFLAVDAGILVKCGSEVLVSTRHAVQGSDLATLKQAVVTQFQQLDERERQTRTAMAQLESNLVRLFMKL